MDTSHSGEALLGQRSSESLKVALVGVDLLTSKIARPGVDREPIAWCAVGHPVLWDRIAVDVEDAVRVGIRVQVVIDPGLLCIDLEDCYPKEVDVLDAVCVEDDLTTNGVGTILRPLKHRQERLAPSFYEGTHRDTSFFEASPTGR